MGVVFCGQDMLNLGIQWSEVRCQGTSRFQKWLSPCALLGRGNVNFSGLNFPSCKMGMTVPQSYCGNHRR